MMTHGATSDRMSPRRRVAARARLALRRFRPAMLASAAAAPAATPRRGLLRAPRLGRRRAAPSAFLAPSVLPPSRDAPGSRPPSSSGARVALGRRAPAPVPGFARASPRPRTLVPPVSAPGATSTEVAGDAPDASSAEIHRIFHRRVLGRLLLLLLLLGRLPLVPHRPRPWPPPRPERRDAVAPVPPLGGEVLHVGWLRGGDPSSVGKVTREEGESDRECLEALVDHYTGGCLDRAQELLRRVERGWADVTLTLGGGYYCRLQRFSEFDTLTLSGPGDPEAPLDRPLPPGSACSHPDGSPPSPAECSSARTSWCGTSTRRRARRRNRSACTRPIRSSLG